MKKYFFAFSVFFVLSSAIHAQYESIRSPLSPEEKEMISRYSLKSMRMYFIGPKGDSLIQMMQYDRNGRLVKTLSEGVLYNYEYNKDGNAVKMTDSLHDNRGKVVNDTFEFRYDNNGFLKYGRFNDDHSDFFFDDSSQTLVETKHDHSWPEPVLSSYTYNIHKNIVEMHYTNASDQSSITERISYTIHDKVHEDFITRAYGEGNIDTVITNYTYNEKNKLILENTYSSSTTSKNHGCTSSTSIRKEFYDKLDRVTQEYLVENGAETERYEFTYNEFSYEPLSETFYSKGTKVRMDNYELDAKGLPITLTETENGVTTRYRYKFEIW